ncbi:uncharacterized protein LOC110026592 [Phalaenopsis equestris]|uniref:uncharacterized protein LOC110026592 n=1 Tax=Phalaenopsis equestris TaxID=78828 RepID=UPI0009E4EA68|nr:uncharacterized protein LOC110026592 [Phalaenopsis equestris]
MSSKKLFISIGTHLHFALDEADLVDGALIKFGEGINDVNITCNGAALTVVDDEVVANMKPIIEFALPSKTEKSSKTEEPVIIDAEKKEVESESSLNPYAFKMGSSSKTARLTRTQRRNRNQRFKRMKERLGFRNMSKPSNNEWSFCGDFGVC